MRFLITHPNFPSQLGPIAEAIARDGRHQVVFLTANDKGEIPGVVKVLFSPAREPRKETHHYLRGLEKSVLQGQAAFRSCLSLKQQGFIPDIILGHSGWGSTLYMKDAFPKTPLICNFEWYYQPHGSDCDFDPTEIMSTDDEARVRTRNAQILLDLAHSDGGITPLNWQRNQFPKIFHPMLKILHEGLDTDYYTPNLSEPLVIPRVNLNLTGKKEILTYVSRGLEPYRGFPQFFEAAMRVLELRPEAHVVIVGEDRVAYGKQLPDGQTYQKLMIEKYQPDMSRVHFTGRLSHQEYRLVLRNSSAHIYLTRPFVLSWSSMEAMSTGCLLIASDTEPVREVMEHEHNALLVNFFDIEKIAQTTADALKNPNDYAKLRTRARETIVTHYDRKEMNERRYAYLTSFIA